ncbi:MAG: AIPR family protein [Saprospiraceae bacterium]|nr:AIPR family protein [Saprospiraceae bacterium]
MNNNLANSEILVRIFKTPPDSNLTNKIEYTNSQNSISIIDLKSLSIEQIQLEQFLDEHNIIYSRKQGILDYLIRNSILIKYQWSDLVKFYIH